LKTDFKLASFFFFSTERTGHELIAVCKQNIYVNTAKENNVVFALAHFVYTVSVSTFQWRLTNI